MRIDQRTQPTPRSRHADRSICVSHRVFVDDSHSYRAIRTRRSIGWPPREPDVSERPRDPVDDTGRFGSRGDGRPGSRAVPVPKAQQDRRVLASTPASGSVATPPYAARPVSKQQHEFGRLRNRVNASTSSSGGGLSLRPNSAIRLCRTAAAARRSLSARAIVQTGPRADERNGDPGITGCRVHANSSRAAQSARFVKPWPRIR